ncbi:MAG: permease [Lachnospiraceae bacterium]|nr:permease [Lachnospiraceae bacterium]MBQ7767218.1 permease [Lachnospiraceae bacterium]
MSLFGGVIPITGITFLMFSLLIITFLGYALGRISIKGVNLGTAGVFIVALLFGCFFYEPLCNQLTVKMADGTAVNYAENALKIVENLGLILFVTSVGFIAGPKFFGNMKKNFKSYVALGLVVIIGGGLSAIGCIFLGRWLQPDVPHDEMTAMIVGLLSGSLTSTPAFSAAKATVDPSLEGIVSVGHGIAYLFGVIGVVLFVQLMPKFMKANMEEERAKLVQASDGEAKKYDGKLIELDGFGIAPFALAAVCGIFVGMIKVPLSAQGLSGTTFALTTTGGCLLMSLVFGHFGRIGKISFMPPETTLKVFRELGLMLFLIGAGIPGGAEFVAEFHVLYFVYGVIMTIVPMILGFLFAKYVVKLSLLNNLGSITGGMTSTPALGTLINTAGTEDVAAAYAATYPIALISVVLVSQFLIILF